jgi:hypothetical protein
MFKPELFDELMRSIISSGDNRAEAILGRITTAIEAQGLPVADLREYLGGHLAGSGVLTTSQPEQNLLGDLEFGLPIAREVVRLNIGQSVLIKDRVVIAVEAIEGTDGMIRRTAPLNLSAAVVIKLPLPSKDPRFDLPVIGSRTIESMKLAGAALLVIAAGQTIIIDPDKCIATADDAGISIIAVDDVTEMES